MAEKSITLEKVFKKFGEFEALEPLSCSLNFGTFYALLGLSGAGKSTLLKILASQAECTGGAGEVLGSPLGREPSHLYSRLSIVAEEAPFHTQRTLRELAEIQKQFRTSWNETQWKQLLAQFELDENRSLETFSRGKKMQAQFCLAIASQPRTLLLDEVTAVMDPATRILVLERCKELARQGATVIFATSLVMELESQVDHLMILHQGKLVYSHAMSEVAQSFKKIRTKDPYAHPVFKMPSCAPLLMNADGTRSYLIPKDRLLQLSSEPGPEFEDRRAITPYEVFLYYTRKTEEAPKEPPKKPGQRPGERPS